MSGPSATHSWSTEPNLTFGQTGTSETQINARAYRDLFTYGQLAPGVRQDLRSKPDLMTAIHQLKALNSITSVGRLTPIELHIGRRWALIARIHMLQRRISRSASHKSGMTRFENPLARDAAAYQPAWAAANPERTAEEPGRIEEFPNDRSADMVIAAATIAGILFRPKDWPESVWAVSGAAARWLGAAASTSRRST